MVNPEQVSMVQNLYNGLLFRELVNKFAKKIHYYD